jgi:hypothetical protein
VNKHSSKELNPKKLSNGIRLGTDSSAKCKAQESSAKLMEKTNGAIKCRKLQEAICS